MIHSIHFFIELFYGHRKITFFIHLTLQAVPNISFCGSIKISELVTNLLSLKSFLKNINILNQFLISSGDSNNLSVIKRKFELNNKLHYSWIQMARRAIPGELKSILRNTHLSNINIYLYHHVIKKIYVLSL